MNNRLRDIPKSRVFSTGFKLFSGLGLFALTFALISGFQSCRPDYVGWKYPPVECTGGQGLIASILGAMSLGWKGGIGDHFIYVVFVALAALGLFLAGFLTVFRDADPRSVAEAARTDVTPAVNPPSQVSYWPALTVFSLMVMVIGLVANTASFVAGAIAVGICVAMWTIRTWAEHATGADTVNEEIRQRVAFGLEVPMIALIIIGATAISLSRVFLSVERLEAVGVAGGMAALFFIAGVAFAYAPRIGKNVMAACVAVAAVLILGAGVIAASVGERDFEHHEEGAGDEGTHGEDEGSGSGEAPATDSTTTTTAADAAGSN